jgi:UDP-N-acetylmuramoyl-tripeptide--D-alanyl-D-alanine ligase
MSAMFTLAQALQWMPGAVLRGSGGVAVQRVHSDTRSLQAGDLFVALKGERFDANDFLADAQAKGAVAAIAHRGRLPADFPGSKSMTASSHSVPWRPAGARSSRCR